MKNLLKIMATGIFRLWSHIYTYRMSQWLKRKRYMLYTLWIRNFLGVVGKNSSFLYPLRLQGGGSKQIRIGSGTSFQPYCVLGCWQKYGSEEKCTYYEPEIIIGNDCMIG